MVTLDTGDDLISCILTPYIQHFTGEGRALKYLLHKTNANQSIEEINRTGQFEKIYFEKL